MKRIIVSALCGVVILCLVFSLWCIQNVVKDNSHNTNTLRGIYMEEPDSLDMIYIGGSAAIAFWSPLQAWHDYGFASYVYGNTSLCPQNILYMMKEASTVQSPKLWVIDARPFQYGMQIVKSGLPRYRDKIYIRNSITGMHPLSPNKAGIIFAGINFFESLNYHFDLLFYRNNFDGILTYWKQQLAERGDLSFLDWNLLLRNETKSPNKGFGAYQTTQPVTIDDLSTITGEEPMDPIMLGYLDELLEWSSQNHQQVLFIVHTNAQTEADKRLYNGMRTRAASYGFDLLNTNDYLTEIGYDFSFDFGDSHHTNIFGAEKYTDFVAKYILEHYDLPDHRDDAAYADWDVCYTEYVPTVEAMKQNVLHPPEEEDAA